jgi:hypothetical protein
VMGTVIGGEGQANRGRHAPLRRKDARKQAVSAVRSSSRSRRKGPPR